MVLFEPTFPMYFDHLQLSGGTLKSVPLSVKDGLWVFDPADFRAALSDKTKLLILNSPHNPTGKCFTRQELESISQILEEFPDVVVLSDEVYDFLTFDGLDHIPFATIGHNWKKTVTVYSGGKLLNATGWKIGWAIGPEPIIRIGGIINNTTAYCTNNPAQIAMSKCLPIIETGTPSFTSEARGNFQEVRDYLDKELKEMSLPWEPLPCSSGYFMMVDISKCRHLIPAKFLETHEYDPADKNGNKIIVNKVNMPNGKVPLDLAFARWMAVENGITMMPGCFFYHPDSPHMSENYVRLAICKDLEATKKVCQKAKDIKV